MTNKHLDYSRPYINNKDRQDHGAKHKGTVQNTHHIIPVSRIAKKSDNATIELFEKLHDDYHGLFGNAVIQEAIEQILRINANALSDKYKKDLYELINAKDEYVYKNGIWIRR